MSQSIPFMRPSDSKSAGPLPKHKDIEGWLFNIDKQIMHLKKDGSLNHVERARQLKHLRLIRADYTYLEEALYK